MSLDIELHAEWMKKRKLTTIAFAIQCLLLECEYGFFIVNLWLYIIEVVKPDNPKVYYILISVSYLLSIAAFSILVSKFADQNRNIRKIIFLTNTAMIVGNIIYMIPFSPWILVIGRIVGGAGQSQRSVMSGELARSYTHDELSSIFSIVAAASGFGFMAAPGINIAFSSVDIWLGNWHITYANFSGLYMVTLFVISQIMTIFFVYDLSKEYDLKGEIESAKEFINNESYCSGTKNVGGTEVTFLLPKEKGKDKMNGAVNYKSNGFPSITSNAVEIIHSHSDDDGIMISSLFKKLLTHYDTSLLLGLTFCESFLIISFDMCLPILVINILKWSIEAYNGIMLGTAIFSILPCILLAFKTISDRNLFYFSIVSVFMYSILQIIQIIWAINVSNMTFNIVLSVLYCFLFADVMIIKNLFLSGFLAKMVSSRHQALTDSIRVAISRIGSIVALTSAPYALERIEIIGVAYICIISTFGFLLLLRRKTISHPHVIIL